MILPAVMPVQVSDQSISEIGQPRGVILRVAGAVKIAFGLRPHEISQPPEHLMRTKPVPRLVPEARMGPPMCRAGTRHTWRA